MRFVTRATLKARLVSSTATSIFIPPSETIDAAPSPDNPVLMRVVWRGQSLEAEEPDFARTTAAASAAAGAR